ncbi:AAA family ATPase [Laribacter hongkongensis]|uniref:AAA family ATPase n=1 Tax=Laribacter hongkongensis TaxID=168471 RepID=UPI001EFDFFCF|nr:AAA family ATPase [Laribacter hongkongensis]MCG9078195.1 AAA family ATPase [Laribacter hongkongensis]
MFIIFSGLPGTGKSTIAQLLAAQTGALWLRIDTIEQAIRSSEVLADNADVGPAGYKAACCIAADNLRLGHKVIADSVNPIKMSRDAYRDTATKLGSQFLEVEIICTDKLLHRNRVETRQVTVEGLVLPTWQQVENHDYEPWDRPCIRLDTSSLSADECVEHIIACLNRVAD